MYLESPLGAAQSASVSRGIRVYMYIYNSTLCKQLRYIYHIRGIQLWFYTAYIMERLKLPTFIYLLFRLFTAQAFILTDIVDKLAYM